MITISAITPNSFDIPRNPFARRSTRELAGEQDKYSIANRLAPKQVKADCLCYIQFQVPSFKFQIS